MWLPDDGKPIFGVNVGPDRKEKPYVLLRTIRRIHPLLRDLVGHRGKTTDLGSIPWLLKVIPGFRPTDAGTRAFWGHDEEYERQEAPRKLIDVVMEMDLRADGMKPWKSKACYIGVRLFGWIAWNEHKRRKARAATQ